MIAIIAAATGVLVVGIIIFIVFYFGLVISFHPYKKAKPDQTRVACVGDSITYGFMVRNRRKNSYPAVLNGLLGEDYCVNNFSYTNRTAIKSGDFPLVNEKTYRQSLEFNPDIVIILLGSNDSKKNNWAKEEFFADYGEIIESYASLEASPKIYLLTPPLVFEVCGKVLYGLDKAVIENEIVPITKELAKSKGVELIDAFEVFAGKSDFFIDGVHPNVKGAKLLAQCVYKKLKKDT